MLMIDCSAARSGCRAMKFGPAVRGAFPLVQPIAIIASTAIQQAYSN
jgi:hypothetical protein